MSKTVSERIGYTDDLPDTILEMIEETGTRRSAMQTKVEAVIESFGGSATLSEIIVGLYRMFGVQVKSRTNVTQLLLGYRNKGYLTKNGKQFVLPMKVAEPDPDQEL